MSWRCAVKVSRYLGYAMLWLYIGTASAELPTGVNANYANPLPPRDGSGAPIDSSKASSGMFFGGVGNSISPGVNGDCMNCAIGAPFASSIPFPGFQKFYTDDVLKRLYRDYADNSAGYEKTKAAFRYKAELFDANKTLALPDISTLWNPAEDSAEERRVDLAIVDVKTALRADPSNKGLRNLLLDIYYDRAVAWALLAKEQQANAAKAAMDFDGFGTPGSLVIDREIGYLASALSHYQKATTGYFGLLSDPIGVPTSAASDPNDRTTDAVFGYHLFVQEVPQRGLSAAIAKDGSPVLDANGDGKPDLITAGYKDLILLFETLRDRTQLATSLATLYAVKGESWGPNGRADANVKKGLELVGRELREVVTARTLLDGLFPRDVIESIDSKSGLLAARSGLTLALSALGSVRSFIDSGRNPLDLPRDFLALVQTETGDSYDYFEDLLIPNGSAGGLGGALADAQNKFDAAKQAYVEFKQNQTSVNTELLNQRRQFADRLRAIVGCAHPEVDPSPKGCSYATPAENTGSDINRQLINIDQAKLRIERNGREIVNLRLQIENEIERRGKERGINSQISQTYIVYGDKQASLTERIADITARQQEAAAASQFLQKVVNVAVAAAATYFTGGAASPGLAATIADLSASGAGAAINGGIQGGYEREKGRLQAQKERLAAEQSARISFLNDQIQDANSTARVKDLLLGMSTLAIDSQEARLGLLVETGKLQALLDEKAYLEAQWIASQDNLANRYFADPTHRLVAIREMLDANLAFKNAQMWVFIMARALDYKWNRSVVAGGYTAESVFKLRNARELVAMATALFDYNKTNQLGERFGNQFVKFSLREDAFGFRRVDSLGNPLTHVDPTTGKMVDAITAFHSQLKLAPRVTPTWGSNKEAIRLTFKTTDANRAGTFFSVDRWNEKIKWLAVTINTDTGLNELVVRLEQHGVSYVRNATRGKVLSATRPDQLVGEMTAYPVRYWYTDVDPNGQQVFKSKDSFGVSVNAALVKDPDTPVETLRKSEFHEMPAAVSEWTLEIPTIHSSGEVLIDPDRIRDIELWFYNYYKQRN